MNPNFPVLIPPTDPDLIRRLKAKLEEYKRREIGTDTPWQKLNRAQALFLYPQFRDVCIKIIILEKILEADKPINTKELFDSMQPPICSENDFKGPCIVINEYLTGERELKIRMPPAVD